MMERLMEPDYHYSSHYRHLCPLTPIPHKPNGWYFVIVDNMKNPPRLT